MRINWFYKILIGAYAFSMFSEGILLPIYAIFVEKVGGDILDASSSMAVFLITQGIFTVVVHRLQWISKHRLAVMSVGWLIWVTGIASYMLVSSVWMLFITQILTAIGNAVADPLFDQELAHHTDSSSEEFEWGFFEGMQSLAQGVAALIGGFIAAYFGFETLIYAMAGAATVSLVLILFYSHTTHRHATARSIS